MPLERLPRQVLGRGEKPSPLARVDRTQAAATHHNDGKDTLQDLLTSLKHLDLTGCITKEEGAKDAHGGYCDVYVGYYLHRNGKRIKVAIKRLRVHILAERNFAKVFHYSFYLCSAGLTLIFYIDSQRRNSCVVETLPSQHPTFRWLCIGKRRLPSSDLRVDGEWNSQ